MPAPDRTQAAVFYGAPNITVGRITEQEFFTRNRELNRADQGIFDRDQRIAFLVPGGYLPLTIWPVMKPTAQAHAVKVFTKLPDRRRLSDRRPKVIVQ